MLFPNLKDAVRFWHDSELYGRGDEDINGRYAVTPAPLPALSIVQNLRLEDDPGLPLLAPVQLPQKQPIPPYPASSPALTPTLAPMQVPSP